VLESRQARFWCLLVLLAYTYICGEPTVFINVPLFACHKCLTGIDDNSIITVYVNVNVREQYVNKER
jgi:hypothetical protein